MKNINFKLRLKNGYTATGLLSTLVIFLKEITGAFGLDLSTQIDQYASGVGAILAFLTAIGVIVDGTTKGFSDSKIAKQYSRPRTDYDPKQALDWEVNLDKKAKAKAQAQKEQQEAQQPSKENKVAKTSADEHTEGNKQAEDEEQNEDDEIIDVDQSEIVDGVEGKEISNGDVRDEIELNNQTAEDTFSDADNEIFGDSAEPQNVGNDTDEEYREKQADADIKGDEIKG